MTACRTAEPAAEACTAQCPTAQRSGRPGAARHAADPRSAEAAIHSAHPCAPHGTAAKRTARHSPHARTAHSARPHVGRGKTAPHPRGATEPAHVAAAKTTHMAATKATHMPTAKTSHVPTAEATVAAAEATVAAAKATVAAAKATPVTPAAAVPTTSAMRLRRVRHAQQDRDPDCHAE